MNEMKSFPFSLFLSRRPSNAFFGDGRVREREKEKGVARERRKSFRMLRAKELTLDANSGYAATRLTVVKAFTAQSLSIQISFLLFLLLFPLLARTGESSREAVTIRSSWPEEKKRKERKCKFLSH
jgi:hypothetical protein